MKPINSKLIADLFKESLQALLRIVRFAMRTLRAMSWPALLLSCVLLALLISVLPLALFLFCVLLAVKLAAAALVVHGRCRKHEDIPPSGPHV